MSNPRSKVLPQLINVYLFVMFAHCADLFVQKLSGDLSVLATNLYGHVVGILCVFVACLVKRKDVRFFGLDFRLKKIFKGVYLGALFSLVPILIVFMFQLGLYAITQSDLIKPKFLPPNITITPYSVGKSFLIFALALIVSTFLKEYFFRGYLLKSARPTYSFSDANIIQSVLYMTLSVATVLRNIVYGKYGPLNEWLSFFVILIVFYVVNDILCGIKLGLLTRVNGNIWAAFFCSYFYRFFAYSLFVSQTKIMQVSSIIRLLAVEIISFAMVWFYYKKGMAEKERKKLEHKLKKLEHRKKVYTGTEEPVSGKRYDKIDNANAGKLEAFSHENFKQQVEDYASVTSHHSHHHHHRSSAPVENDDLGSLGETDVEQYRREHEKQIVDSVGRHHSHHTSGEARRDDKLIGLGKMNVGDFYKEYAKAVEQGFDDETKNVKEKIEKIGDKDKPKNKKQ